MKIFSLLISSLTIHIVITSPSSDYIQFDNTTQFCANFQLDFNPQQSSFAREIGYNTRLHFQSKDLYDAFDQGHKQKVQNKFMYDGLPSAIGFAISFLIWPFLCCCCCCPDSHPVCEDCRKPPTQSYKSFELKWPTTVLVIACLVMIGGGAMVLMSNTNGIGDEVNNVMCKVLRLQDKTVNGFKSREQGSDKQFSGYKNINDNLQYLASNNYLTSYYPTITLFDTINQIPLRQQSFQAALADIYTNYDGFTYDNVFYNTERTTVYDIPSLFKDFLGPYDQPHTVLGSLKQQLHTVFDQINQYQLPLWESFQTLIQISSFENPQQKLTNASRVMNDQTLKDLTEGYYRNVDRYNKYHPLINRYSKLITPVTSAFVAIASISIISALAMLLSRVPSCRNILYLACFLITILTFAMFLSGVVLSILDTMIQHSCTYFLADFTAGLKILHYHYNDQYSQAARKYLTNCASNSKGNVLHFMPEDYHIWRVDELWSNLNRFESVIYEAQFQAYNSSTIGILTDFYFFELQKIKIGQVMDINDSRAFDYLQSLANKELSTTGCNSQLQFDSYIPTHSNNKINCSVENIMYNCNDLSSFSNCPVGCYGIYELFQYGDTSYADHLQDRYGASCTYATYLPQLHQNWHLVRQAQVEDIAFQIVMNFDGGPGMAYWNSASNFQSTIETAKTDLSNFYSGLTSPRVYRSSDCTLLEEPIEQLANALCSRFYPIVQSMHIGFTLMGWAGIIFMMTAVCTGVRQFKNQRLMKQNAIVSLDQQASDYKFVEREQQQNRSNVYFVQQSHEDLFEKRRKN